MDTEDTPETPLIPTVVKPLPLSKLAAKIRTEFNQAERTAKQLHRHVVQCGKYLLEAKARVRHGQFADWCEENCRPLSERMAQNFMGFARLHLNSSPEEQKRLEGLTSIRQMIAAVAAAKDEKPETPVKDKKTKKKPAHGGPVCSASRGCVREATAIVSCGAHMLNVFREWLENDASREELNEVLQTVSRLIDERNEKTA